MCTSCISTFFDNPINTTIAITSVLLAIILILTFILRRNSLGNTTKVALLYLIAFSSFFPLVYYLASRTCQSSQFAYCGPIHQFLYTVIITFLISAAAGFLSLPFLMTLSSSNNIICSNPSIQEKLREFAKKWSIKLPRVRILNRADPIAFSITYIRPSIFLSVGLLELLGPQEREAVLLHELGHIRQHTSLLKFTSTIFRVISPFSGFNILHDELALEESDADKFVVLAQGTDRYLTAARKKIISYYREKRNAPHISESLQ